MTLPKYQMEHTEVFHNLATQLMPAKNQNICCHQNQLNAVHAEMDSLKKIHHCWKKRDWKSRCGKIDMASQKACGKNLQAMMNQGVGGSPIIASQILSHSMGTTMPM